MAPPASKLPKADTADMTEVMEPALVAYPVIFAVLSIGSKGATAGSVALVKSCVIDAGVVGTAGLDVLAVGRNSELVVTPLPEPGTMVLMFGAMVAGCVLRRRS